MGSVLAEASETGIEQWLAFSRPNGDDNERLLPSDSLPAPVLVPEVKFADANDIEDKTRWEKRQKLEVRPLVRFSSFKPPARKFEVLQQFEGIVTSVDGDSVWADLHDLTVPSNPLEVVEIPLKEFPIADAQLLTSGSAFYWIIGYDTSPGGTITRASEIRVRRTAKWSHRAVSAIKAKAHEMFLLLTNGRKE